MKGFELVVTFVVIVVYFFWYRNKQVDKVHKQVKSKINQTFQKIYDDLDAIDKLSEIKPRHNRRKNDRNRLQNY